MLNELNTTLLLSAWTFELTSELIAFALLLCFVGLSNLEARFPKTKCSKKDKRQSYKTNVSLFMFNSVLMSIGSVSTLYIIAERYSGYGLLNYISNTSVKALLSFLAMDLLLYFWHRVCHRVDVLWMFHRVHHNDTYLNVSTAFRIHFVEVLATNGLKALLIILLGIDKALVLTIEAVVTLSIMFHHTNTAFKYEYIMSRFFIVPFLHRVHHSTERSEHDRNYGAVLSLWDKLFGTLLDVEPKAIGIKGSSPLGLINLIKFGFSWESPTTPVAISLPDNLDEMIAEAAYYKAEKRNFYPGYDYRDWLEAKAEILNQVAGNHKYPGGLSWNNKTNDFKSKLHNCCQTLRQRSLKDIMHIKFQ